MKVEMESILQPFEESQQTTTDEPTHSTPELRQNRINNNSVLCKTEELLNNRHILVSSSAKGEAKLSYEMGLQSNENFS